jgi:uncharacterized protein (TIGR03437 family)
MMRTLLRSGPALLAAVLANAQPGIITTIAGTGVAGFSGDGGPAAAAQLNMPNGVAVDDAFNVYIADYANSRIRKVTPAGTISTVASCGLPSASCLLPLNLGDGGPATGVWIANSWDVVVDKAGNLYMTDSGANRIRKVTPSGTLSTYAGSGAPGVSSSGFSGDGGPATSARLNNPVGLEIDAAGNIYFADLNNQRVRKIDTNGIITTIAGTGTVGFSGDGGPATSARLNAPHGVGVDAQGNVYIADTTNYRIRKVTPAGIISTVSGNGEVITINPNGTIRGNGDNGPAINANIVPWDVKADAAGNLYISDWTGNRIRKVDTAGVITTIAGTGAAGFGGDGQAAASARINLPAGLKVDNAGNVYFADSLNHRVRRVNAPPLGPPAIRTVNPVVPSFMGAAGFSSSMYVEIHGSNFSRVSRTWTGADFNGPNAPTSLEGVRVSIGGKPAFIYYVSPSQINVNVPDDTATGPGTQVVVTTDAGVSNSVSVTRSRLSPAMLTTPAFNIGGRQYVAALTPDFVSFIGRPNMIPGVSFVLPRPGDSVSIYALGAGPTVPATQAGVAAAQNSPLALPYQVRVGGVPAPVGFAGMLAGTIGLYQLNVTIPSVSAGDQPIEFIVDGVANNQNLFIPVGP